MPRDGSGVYSKPVGTTAVPNTTIESSKYNSTIDDLVTDANTDRPIVAGGTGASSAADARTNLGLVIGTNVQAYDAGLQSIAGLTTAADKLPYTTASDTYAVTTLTAFGRSLIDDADASTARTTMGLGTIATQASSSVSITGGSVTGITDLAVADGGTGASTAANARTNLGLVAVASSGSAADLTTGTLADARLPTSQAGKTFTSTVAISGAPLSMESTSATTGANRGVRFKVDGTEYGSAYYDNTRMLFSTSGSDFLFNKAIVANASPVKSSVAGGTAAGDRGFRQNIDGSEFLALYHNNSDPLLTGPGTFKFNGYTVWHAGNASDNSVTWFDDIPNPPAGRVRMPGRNASGDRVYVTIDSSTGAFISVTTY